MIFLGCLLAWNVARAEPDAEHVFVSPTLAEELGRRAFYSVAVLPIENVSADPEVAHHFRHRIQERLKDKGYNLVDGEWVDAALHELGLADSRQIELAPLAQLGELVGADAFVFGRIEDATTRHAVVYNDYTYKASLLMRQAQGDGAVLWRALEETIAKQRVATDPISAVFDFVLTEVGSAQKSSYAALVDRLLQSLPSGPVQVLVGEDLLSQAVTVEPSAPRRQTHADNQKALEP